MIYYIENMALMKLMYLKAIPFDIPSLLTAQDKFDILIYMYKNDFGYEALTELIKKIQPSRIKICSRRN